MYNILKDTMKQKITKKQNDVFEAIKKLTKKNGQSPTLRELMEYLDYKSTSSVQRHTEALKKKNVLKSEKHQERSFKIETKTTRKKIYSIPLVGIASCGQPQLAVQDIEAYIPYEVNGDPKEYFFLKTEGDSMNKAGIEEGNIVLIHKQPVASNGDIVVALIEDDATIKFFRKEKNKVILEPSSTNPKHKPIYVYNNLQIQGIVIKVIKN